MSKYCRNCGAPLDENTQYCQNCGAKVEEEAPKYGEAPQAEPQSAETVNTAGIKERSIAAAIIFSIITCGIYMLYWVYQMNENLNQLVYEGKKTSGGLVIVLTIITCGIYGWYWNYKMGEKVDKLKKSDSNKIVFIILAIFGLSIINLAIMQDAVNKEVG